MSGLIFIPLIGAMVWLMIVPQRRQQKQHQLLLAKLDDGDAVVTTSGIYGVITEIDGDVVYLEVAEGIELKVAKSAVSRKLTDSEPADATPDVETEAPSEGK